MRILIPPQYKLLKNNPAGETTGSRASITRSEYVPQGGSIPFAQITVASPVQATTLPLHGLFTLQLQGPFEASRRAEFSPHTALCADALACTRPLRRIQISTGKKYITVKK
jgi:hypothetical protein